MLQGAVCFQAAPYLFILSFLFLTTAEAVEDLFSHAGMKNILPLK